MIAASSVDFCQIDVRPEHARERPDFPAHPERSRAGWLATKATGGERPDPDATGRARCSSARMATRRPGGPSCGHPLSRDTGQKRYGVGRR